MKSTKLITVLAAVCIVSGCSQNRWQARRGPTVDGYQPPQRLAGAESLPPNQQIEATPQLTAVASDADATPYISLVSATENEVQAGSAVAVLTDSAVPVADSAGVKMGMSLSEFESLAFAHNPAIRELAATTQKAAGYRTQVSLRPNPTIGYAAQQLADRNTDQHIAFVEQEFVTAGKLELNRCVLNETLRAQLMELEAQKLRVATDVRVQFYAALAAQQRIELIEDFESVVDKGVEVAELRVKAAEGSKLEVLQATIQKNEIDLARQQASVRFAAAWRRLIALTGTPYIEPSTLIGELPVETQTQDWSLVKSTIVSSSPEYNAAQTRVSRARAQLQRHGVQAVPNLTFQLGAGVDNGTNNGMLNFQVSAPVPVFNGNEGNIAAARAEFCRAALEVQRVEKSIEARLAEVSGDYDAALAAVDKYVSHILPNANESLKLAELAYEAGETSFVQVLVARRTYFDSNLQLIAAQTQLAQAKSKVDGFVLTGGLDPVVDNSGDDSLRGLTFGQQ